jgi:HTH-type transcriptional regulator / antitoxin HigA
MEAAMRSRTIIKSIADPKKLGPFVAIRTEAEYHRAGAELDALVDEVGDRPNDPRYRLIETLSILIEAYDQGHDTLPPVTGADLVRFLMEQHNLTQGDLPEIGTQGVVSEILSGRRSLNVRQIEALAARFGVHPGAFLVVTS